MYSVAVQLQVTFTDCPGVPPVPRNGTSALRWSTMLLCRMLFRMTGDVLENGPEGASPSFEWLHAWQVVTVANMASRGMTI